jgi:RNA polymerase sigma-70 factor (ECF subfamily)
MENHKRAPRTNLPDELEDRSEPSNDHRIRLLYKCISELGEMDRIIISLELEDIRQAEIAEITGISESHVRVKIHRIREKLTKKFKQYE